eukprot:gene24839-30265_t
MRMVCGHSFYFLQFCYCRLKVAETKEPAGEAAKGPVSGPIQAGAVVDVFAKHQPDCERIATSIATINPQSEKGLRSMVCARATVVAVGEDGGDTPSINVTGLKLPDGVVELYVLWVIDCPTEVMHPVERLLTHHEAAVEVLLQANTTPASELEHSMASIMEAKNVAW